MSAGVQHVFTQHHKEIRRRAELADDSLNASTFERVETDGVDDPFYHQDQQYVVFTLSQQEFAPVPVDPSNPAVCIYGTFAEANEAREFARTVQQEHPEYSVLIDRTHQWIVASATMAHLSDAAYVQGHRDALLQRVQTELEQNRREFEENVEKKRVGRLSKPCMDEDTVVDAPHDDRGRKRKVAKTCRVDDQKLAVVSFVADTASPPEFLFYIYACYDNEQDANKYVRNTCGNRIRDHNIDVVQTCQWIHPQVMQPAQVPREVFRSSELNKVMQCHKKNPQEVERFYRHHADWEVVDKHDAAREIESQNSRDKSASCPLSSAATSATEASIEGTCL